MSPETITVKRLAASDRSRVFLDGSRRDVVTLSSAAVGRGDYRPGWRWSLHAGPMTGRPSERHIGYVISGRMMVESSDGRQIEIGPNEAFEAAPGHDAWVVGNEPCVALDFSAL